MKPLMFIVLFFTTVMTLSCRMQDIRVFKVHVPEMRNQACADVVEKALTKLYGIQIDNIKIDIPGRMVTVKYDSLKLAHKNIEFVIAEAGFEANQVPAKQEAVKALSPECFR